MKRLKSLVRGGANGNRTKRQTPVYDSPIKARETSLPIVDKVAVNDDDAIVPRSKNRPKAVSMSPVHFELPRRKLKAVSPLKEEIDNDNSKTMVAVVQKRRSSLPNLVSLQKEPGLICESSELRDAMEGRETRSKSDKIMKLQQQLNAQNTGAQNEDLRVQLAKQKQENDQKLAELRRLQRKVAELEQFKSKIEKERKTWSNSTSSLEVQKKEIQNQLDLREQEITTLVRRCSSQEEGMREAGKIRSTHQDLVQEVHDLRHQLLVKEQEAMTAESLQKQLEKCNEERDELSARLIKVKRDHDHVVNTLNSCFEKMQEMEIGQKSYGEHRQREQQRSGIVLERQRQEHMKTMKELRADLDKGQERVKQMEEILKHNMASVNSLRKEKAELEKKRVEEISSLKEQHEQAINLIEEGHKNDKMLCTENYGSQIQSLRTELATKDAIISSLEEEVSQHMDKLMAISSEIDQLKEENTAGKGSVEKELEVALRVKSQLEEALEGKDIEVSVLTMKLANAESEKTDAIVDLKRMEERVQELEDENAFILDLEHQLNEINLSTYGIEDEKGRLERKHKADIQTLKEDFEDQRQMWKTMENGLVEHLSEVEKEYCIATQELVTQLEEERSEVKSTKEALMAERETTQSLRVELDTQRNTVTRLEKSLKKVEDLLVEKQETKNSLDPNKIGSSSSEVVTMKTLSANERKTSKILESELDSEKEVDLVQSDLEEEGKSYYEKAEEFDRLQSTSNQSKKDSEQGEESALIQLKNQNQNAAMFEMQLKEEQERASNYIEDIKVLRKELEERNAQIHVMEEQNTAISEKIHESEKELIEARASQEENIRMHDEEKTNLIEEAKLKHDKICSELHNKEALINKLTGTVDRLEEQAQKYTQSLDTAEKQLTELKAELTKMNEHVSSVESSKKDIEIELQMESARNLQLDELVKSMKEEVQEAKAKTSVSTSDLELQKDELSMQVQKLAIELEETKGSFGASSERETQFRLKLKSQSEVFEKETNSLQEKITRMERATVDVHNKLQLEVEKNRMKTENTKKVETRLKEVTESHDQKMKEIRSLKAELQRLQNTQELDSCRNEAQIQSLKDSVKSLESQLETAQLELQNKVVEADSLNADLTTADEDLKLERATLRRQFGDQEKLITSIRNDLQEERMHRTKADASTSSLKAEVERMRSKLEQGKRDWNRLSVDQEETIASLKSELIVTQESGQSQISTLKSKLTDTESQLVIAKTKLEDIESHQANLNQRSEQKLHAKDVEIARLQEAKEKFDTEREANDQRLEKVQQSKSQEVAALEEEIGSLKRQEKENQHKFQCEVEQLKAKLVKANLEEAILRDEIRDLKVIELRDAQDTIESLESELNELKQTSESGEKATTTKITSLKSEVTFLQSELNKRKQEINDNEYFQSKNASKLESESASLREANVTLSNDLKSMSQKLEERHSAIVEQTSKIESLQKKETSLEIEVKKLSLEIERANDETQKISFALEREIEKNRTLRGDGDIEAQKKVTAIQKQLLDKEAELGYTKNSLDELEQQLESRSNLLADMVSHNKSVEESRDNSQKELVDLKASFDRLRLTKVELESENEKLRKIFSAKESQFLEMIETEREKREMTESYLLSLRGSMKESKRESKEVTELQKENSELRDKIKRQDAYMKRRLQKEKIFRERNTKTLIAAPTRRIQSPRKRRQVASSSSILNSTAITTPSIVSTSLISTSSSFTEFDWDENGSLLSK